MLSETLNRKWKQQQKKFPFKIMNRGVCNSWLKVNDKNTGEVSLKYEDRKKAKEFYKDISSSCIESKHRYSRSTN